MHVYVSPAWIRVLTIDVHACCLLPTLAAPRFIIAVSPLFRISYCEWPGMHQETNCCCVLYSYFRGVLIFVIFVVNTRVTKFSKFPPTLQLCLHVLTFGPSNVFYSPFSLLVPCWQCPWSIGSPFSSCPMCGDGGSEQRSEQGRSTNGASTSRLDMPAPMEFVLCRRGSLQCKTWHWSTPSFLWSRVARWNFKPRNLILRASSSFSRKYPPTEIIHYTVCGNFVWLGDQKSLYNLSPDQGAMIPVTGLQVKTRRWMVVCLALSVPQLMLSSLPNGSGGPCRRRGEEGPLIAGGWGGLTGIP